MTPRDGRIRHRCSEFPRSLTGQSARIRRGDEWDCPACGQVWVALVPRPHDNPRNHDWKRLRSGLLRRPVRAMKGVSAGYAATAGARVSPVQTSVHADTTVADEGGTS